ncbi:sigma-70 family RNA polymerase sigma factor [Pendulispora rubella]|uniref:Sigma-70 family RNA polymerase sigma factor n=1 Tax=Pendulispora rubella TaxID=2741070 RepID=A0ABZ2L4S0_9BACT
MRTRESSCQITQVEPACEDERRSPTLRDIFDSELHFVWRSLRRLGVPDRDLEDVAHEVFVVVHRHLGQYDPARPLRPWLFAMAFRCASEYRRRPRHRREVFEDQTLDHSDSAEPVDEALMRAQERNIARQALLRVPEDRRAVLILHDFDEVPMHEVAAALEIPLKTAYSRLRIGREELIAAARRLQKRRSVNAEQP